MRLDGGQLVLSCGVGIRNNSSPEHESSFFFHQPYAESLSAVLYVRVLKQRILKLVNCINLFIISTHVCNFGLIILLKLITLNIFAFRLSRIIMLFALIRTNFGLKNILLQIQTLGMLFWLIYLQQTQNPQLLLFWSKAKILY